MTKAKGNSRRSPRLARSDLLMVALVAAFVGGAALWSDRIPVNNGMGWDGAYYGLIAADPIGAVHHGDLDSYGVQRILPSIVVYAALRTVRAEPTPQHIVAAFEVLNALLLTLGAALWVAIARTLRLAPRIAWLGWMGLFVNFAIMRQASYYPVLTDVSAFVVGLGMLLCFVRRWRVALAVVMLAGAFVWPVATVVGFLLLAAPSAPLPERAERGDLAMLAAIGAATGVCALTSYLYFMKDLEWQPGIHVTIVASIALVTVFVFIVTVTMLRGARFQDVGMIAKAIEIRDVALTAGVLCAVFLVDHALVHNTGGGYTRSMLRSLGMLAVAKPFNFFVPHAVYFGPIVCLVVPTWREFTRVAREWGIGVVGVILLTIGLGLNSESRQAMLGFPIVVAVTVVAIGRQGWPARANWLVAAFGLVASKIWMPMPLIDGPTTDATIVHYPMQLYFLNHGPWISTPNFLWQSAAVAIITLSLWAVARAARSSADGAGSTLPMTISGEV